MTLPLAVVERWPMEEYKLQHDNLVDALKHINRDAVALYHELQDLRTQFRKTADKANKRFDKNLDVVIRDKE